MRREPPRLKWHQLRRRRTDPVFLRGNLEAALASRAACEVDLVLTGDGHFVCLHDLTLNAETTGTGPVNAASRAEIEHLRQRGPDGTVLTDPPLFLDEVVAAARRHGLPPTGLLQLDIKEPDSSIGTAVLDRLAATLGDDAAAFVAGGCDWTAVCRLAAAAPGLHRGFDPGDLYAAEPVHSAHDFRRLAEQALGIAPDAAIYYLEADIVLAGLSVGVNLVELVRCNGAEVDAWTVDADRPWLREVLRLLIAAGCHQITTNDPEALAPLVGEIAPWS
jgi:glycerophosphoryl diester phosphodiesterase